MKTSLKMIRPNPYDTDIYRFDGISLAANVPKQSLTVGTYISKLKYIEGAGVLNIYLSDGSNIIINNFLTISDIQVAVNNSAGPILPIGAFDGQQFFLTFASPGYPVGLYTCYDTLSWVNISSSVGASAGPDFPNTPADGQQFYLTVEKNIYFPAGLYTYSKVTTVWTNSGVAGLNSGINFPLYPVAGQQFFKTAASSEYPLGLYECSNLLKWRVSTANASVGTAFPQFPGNGYQFYLTSSITGTPGYAAGFYVYVAGTATTTDYWQYIELTFRKGFKGVDGLNGLNGHEGQNGLIGATGAAGPTGPIGPTGAKGITGPTGDYGVDGPKGEAGTQGPVGPTGPTGPQGIQGVLGDPGNDGGTNIFYGRYEPDASTYANVPNPIWILV